MVRVKYKAYRLTFHSFLLSYRLWLLMRKSKTNDHDSWGPTGGILGNDQFEIWYQFPPESIINLLQTGLLVSVSKVFRLHIPCHNTSSRGNRSVAAWKAAGQPRTTGLHRRTRALGLARELIKGSHLRLDATKEWEGDRLTGSCGPSPTNCWLEGYALWFFLKESLKIWSSDNWA